MFPLSQFYIIGRYTESVPTNQPQYVDDHRHNCNSFYVFAGNASELSGLRAEVSIEGVLHNVASPCAAMVPAGALHHYRLTGGAGWFFHINLCPSYADSLCAPETSVKPPAIRSLENMCSQALLITDVVRPGERPLQALTTCIANPERWIFVSPSQFTAPGVYVAMHRVLPGLPYQYRMNLHCHETDEVYVLVGQRGEELEIEISGLDSPRTVISPGTVYHLPGTPHRYAHYRGSGLILIVLREARPGTGYGFRSGQFQRTNSRVGRSARRPAQ